MGVHIIDYVASFVILLGLLTFTITTSTGTLDNLFIYHQNLELNSVATNLLNNLLGSTGSPSDWAQSTADPTSIGLAWSIGDGNHVNPFVPLRMMDVTVETMYGSVAYNDLSLTTLGEWPGVNLYFKAEDSVEYTNAAQLLNTVQDFNWRVTYTPAYNVEVSTSMPAIIPWYAGWGYRMELTIDHTKFSAPMYDYQLLVSVTQPTLQSNARSDGGDILFTASDKLTKIPHELDRFDPISGKVTAWVKIPVVSDVSDTIIYMYYGNPTAPNQASPTLVWSGYNSVFHMEDVPDSSHIEDSTASGQIGSKSGDHEPAEIINGAVSYAQGFDGSNDFVSLSQATLSGSYEVFEMWLKSTKSSTLQTIISNGVKNTTTGFIDISRLPQTNDSSGDDLLIDYAVNGGWVQKAGSVGVNMTCVVVFKNNIYGGTSDGKFYQWDGVNSWIARPSLPSGDAFSSLITFNNKLYAGASPSANLYEYDEGYSVWIKRAPAVKILSLTLYSDKIYGGTNDGRLLRWNTATYKWDEVASMLGSETFINCLTIYNSAIYAGTSPGGKLYKWDGASAWIQTANPSTLTPFTDIVSITTFNSKIYAGTNPGGYLVSWTSGAYWVVEKTTGETAITSLSGYPVSTMSQYNFTSNSGFWSSPDLAVSPNSQYAYHTPSIATTRYNPTSHIAVGSGWTNPTRAYSDNTQYATTATNGRQHIYSGFTSLASDALITTLRIRVDAYSPSSTNTITVAISTDGGSTYQNVYTTPGLSSSQATYWVDITSLRSWTPSMVNNLRLRVQANRPSTGTIYLDWLPIEVTYYSTTTHTFSNFNVVAGSTISKVEVGVKGYTPGNSQLSVVVSWDAGSSWSNPQVIALPAANPSSPSYLDFTGETSWTSTKLSNTNFRIRIVDVLPGPASSTSFVDYICARITSSSDLLSAGTSPHTYVWVLSATGTWTQVITAQHSTETSLSSLAVCGGSLYGLTAPSGILVKQGTGGSSNTWVLAASPPTTQTITTMITDGTTIYGGSTPNGLLYKSTGGAWSAVVSTQYNGEASILSLAFDSTNNRVEAGTSTNGYLLGALKSQTDGSWTKDAEITTATETKISSMAIYNSKLYLGTSPHGLLYEWDGSNALVQRAPQYTSQTRINSMAVLGGSLYGGTSSGSLLEWTTGDAAWAQVAVPFGTETSVNSVVSYNNKIYGSTFPGGRLLEWNGAGAWVGKTYILGSETSVSSLIVYNGKLYGGTSPGGMLYEWDGATKWVKMADTYNGQTSIPSMAVYNSKLYGATSGGGYLFEFSDVGERIIPNFFTGSEDRWVSLNLVFDYANEVITIYRNGTLLPVTLSTPNIIKPLKTPKYLGGFIVSGIAFNPYDGYIDELRIDESPLSDIWISQNFDNQRLPEPYTGLGAEESIFFKVNVRVTGKDGPISGATTSGSLVYCTSGVTTPSYGVLYSESEVTDAKGEAEIEFRGYTSDNPAYFILVRAEHYGMSGVDYYVSESPLAEDPIGVFVTNYDDGELTLTHKKDFDAVYSDATSVAYNATFILPIGNDYYRSVDLESAGTISLGSPGVVQLQDTKESTGVLLVFYKTSTNLYGVTFTPWGVSALGLEATFGAPIKDATNVITKTKVVNIGAYTYEVKAEIWTSQR